MELKTKYFGTVSYAEDETVYFSEGLFGFEHYKDYLPIAFQDGDDAMILLQSITEEHIAFILVNPFYLLEDYNPVLLTSDRKAIGSPKDEDISYYVICTLKDDASKSTVNLKCPIIVNAHTRCAKQVILDSSVYQFRHALESITKKED
ncbi:MAG: flagellar assembly protein FliW [Lachnospiraceae bacterium]